MSTCRAVKAVYVTVLHTPFRARSVRKAADHAVGLRAGVQAVAERHRACRAEDDKRGKQRASARHRILTLRTRKGVEGLEGLGGYRWGIRVC